MDVAGAGTADGTNIQEWTCNGTGAQSFQLQAIDSTWFKIVNRNSGKCVDVASNGTADLSNIRLWTCNDTGAQAWKFVPSGSFFTIVGQTSNKCIDVAAAGTADGTNIRLLSCNGAAAQNWAPADIGTGCNATVWACGPDAGCPNGPLYHTGDIVLYQANGNYYKATHDNAGPDPTVSTFFWSPTTCGGGDSPWRLTWSDEFDGAGAVDGSHWGFDIGAGGWGNNELQYYTDRTDNVRLNGQGQLEIVARAESFGGASFTSGRINTSGLFSQAYGRFEALIKLPSGNGIWPAFWTLGDNRDTAGVGWPSCGELDIMEVVRNFSINHGSAHGPGYSGGNPLTATYQLPSGSFSDGFHLFAIEWEPNEVRWYVDSVMYERRTPADLPSGTHWVYDHPFFILLNVAVGGGFPGPPDGSTVFPQTMQVDYVRVYSK
jgi:hypothetical protein